MFLHGQIQGSPKKSSKKSPLDQQANQPARHFVKLFAPNTTFVVYLH